MGDRFGHQGMAQLTAVSRAAREGIQVCPVWNKSNREHSIIGSGPADVRAEADAATRALGWSAPYFVDADHIGLATVDRFVEASDFFTLDVADFVGRSGGDVGPLKAFLERFGKEVRVPGIAGPLSLDAATVDAACSKFLRAMQEAGAIHRHIVAVKGEGNFVTEVSVDETDAPQSPAELLLILAMLAVEGVPVRTIAPKFTGRFNKGVDYVGDVARFEKEFDEDLHVLAFAVREFGLPGDLKLSVHSGSDKFSIYPAINRLIKAHGCGLHVKTAGTTWLEEIIGLAEAGGDGLALAAEVYAGAHEKMDALMAPYATVIDIDQSRLPAPAEVAGWTSGQFVAALRHDPSDPRYNPHLRQLVHVAFKVAAAMGTRYTDALDRYSEVIGRNVTTNLLERHIRPIFG
jgi:hypothetical protein